MVRLSLWMTTRFFVTVAVILGSLHLKNGNAQIYFACRAELNLLRSFSTVISNVFRTKAISLKMESLPCLVGKK
jgi:hypothetical protein